MQRKPNIHSRRLNAKLLHFLLTLLVLLTTGTKVHADNSEEADQVPATLPAEHPFFSCATCHGTQGEGNEALLSPRLAGQKTSYLKHQLMAFQKGWRGEDAQDVQGKLMATAISSMNASQLDAALKYLETLEVKMPSTIATKGSLDRGRFLYERNCLICHGEAGQGSEVEPLVPRLDIQYAWYMEKQLKHYRTRLRGFHPNDAMGGSMGFYAKLLPDEQAITEVIAWVQYSAEKKRKSDKSLKK